MSRDQLADGYLAWHAPDQLSSLAIGLAKADRVVDGVLFRGAALADEGVVSEAIGFD